MKKTIDVFKKYAGGFCAAMGTVALTALIGFSMTACDTGGPGSGPVKDAGRIPVLESPDISRDLANYEVGETAVPEPERIRDLILPIIKLLGDKHDEIDDAIIDRAERGVSTDYFNYDAAASNGRALEREGITEVSGMIEGSRTKTRSHEIFDVSNIDLEYTYDSDYDMDDDTQRMLDAGEFVRGRIKAAGSLREEDNESIDFESEEEQMAISFAIAVKYGTYSGKIAAELGYSYKEVEERGRDTEYRPQVRAKFSFFDNDGNLLEEHEVTDRQDLRRIFKFYD